MDFILDPNLAYLIVMATLWLVLMALATPGTGIVEIGALFALVLSGWAVFTLPVNYWALGLMLFGVLPFGIAVRLSGNRILMAIGLVCIMSGSAFVFRGESWLPAVNPLLALLISLTSAGLLWLLATKILETELSTPTHDLGKLIGAVGEARTDIKEEGSVYVAGELWSAQSDQLILNGSQVRVVSREGFTLKVEALERGGAASAAPD